MFKCVIYIRSDSQNCKQQDAGHYEVHEILSVCGMRNSIISISAIDNRLMGSRSTIIHGRLLLLELVISSSSHGRGLMFHPSSSSSSSTNTTATTMSALWPVLTSSSCRSRSILPLHSSCSYSSLGSFLPHSILRDTMKLTCSRMRIIIVLRRRGGKNEERM